MSDAQITPAFDALVFDTLVTPAFDMRVDVSTVVAPVRVVIYA
jgi:hypothetical protein